MTNHRFPDALRCHRTGLRARGLVAVLVVILSVTLGVTTSSCSRGGSQRGSGSGDFADREGFNIALVVVDALRADRLGCYGFERPTSPVIDAICNEPDAVVFENHYVQAAWTKASTASLFTGLFVRQHGVVLGHETTQRTGQWREYTTQILPDDHVTMAEHFQSAGYETFGVVKSQHLVPDYGFSQGFDDYYTPSDMGKDRKRVAKFLDLARGSDRRFFGYLHLEGVHHPFPEETRDADYIAEFGFDYDEASRRTAGVDFSKVDIGHDIKHGRRTLDEADARFLNLIYEAELRHADRDLVGVLVEGLKESGLYDNTLLILTADHGEELYDHEGYAHGHALWEEIIHVPLIVKFPKDTRPVSLARTVAAPTRSIDLLPAILALLGRPKPENLPGLPIFHGVQPEYVISETKREWTIIQDGWKLIGGDRNPMLFHLPRDRGERNDLASDEPERVASMSARFEELAQAGAGGAVPAPMVETTLTEQEEEALRSLGYLE